MTLTQREQMRLQELLWKAQSMPPLWPSEEVELRALVGRQNPAAARFPIGELVGAGLVVLGAILVFKALSDE